MDKIIDNLYLGDLKAAQDPDELAKHYITHIVQLGRDLKPMYPKKYAYLEVPVDDDATENIGKHFNAVAKFAKSGIRRDAANVLIHCMTGNNLSACFVAAYLIKVHDYGVVDAFKHIKRQRSKVKPNAIFVSQLNNYSLIVGAERKRFEAQQA